jgi:hypothetical protein
METATAAMRMLFKINGFSTCRPHLAQRRDHSSGSQVILDLLRRSNQPQAWMAAVAPTSFAKGTIPAVKGIAPFAKPH